MIASENTRIRIPIFPYKAQYCYSLLKLIAIRHPIVTDASPADGRGQRIYE
ncbi:hypothetical protein [Nostoc sp.]|uniref:hypothetical protein n=1 Tax=Nostoc sp. TaxID=1180 RepID=UPI002FFCF7BD